MPGFDGTGPRGEGPFTGRGEGYCAVKLPDEGSAEHAERERVIGFAGQQGRPIHLAPLSSAVAGWPRPPQAPALWWYRPPLVTRRTWRPRRGHREHRGRWFTRR